MPRQTITRNDPNHAWPQSRVESSVEAIRAILLQAEARGFSDPATIDEIWNEAEHGADL